MESVITIKELSFLSGYSVSTVSKALNNKKDISNETKAIIKDIAEKHNYIPNNYAIALRKKRAQSIAVILPQVNTNHYSDSLFNIQKSAIKFGYRVMIYQSFNEDLIEKKYIRNINDGTVDGIILLSEHKKLEYNYEKINALPMECIQVLSVQSQNQLKKVCLEGFSRLLNKIVMY